MSILMPALFIMFLWWFSTGAVLWLARRASGDSLMTNVSLLLVSAAGFMGASLPATALPNQYWLAATPTQAILGVCSALAIWAVIEFTFLTRRITGPRKRPCPDNVTGKARFILAYNVVSHHEYLLVAALTALSILGLASGQFIAAATFGLLWLLRISAKLSLFSGVPKFSLELMPSKLSYMKSYFRIGTSSKVFVAFTGFLTVGTAAAISALVFTELAHEELYAATMLATLLALGTLEHWFMALPIQDSALWRWAASTHSEPETRAAKTNNKVHAGFGSRHQSAKASCPMRAFVPEKINQTNTRNNDNTQQHFVLAAGLGAAGDN